MPTDSGPLAPRTQSFYRDLAAWMAQRRGAQRCPIFGINGAQGSGKSTAARFLQGELSAVHGLRAVALSLDDFYLPRAARHALAAQVHPLFATRGVPGTHDPALGTRTLTQLRALTVGKTLALPRFSKADDERMPAADWQRVEGPVDLILLEGWCVGLPAQPQALLQTPVNELEAREDADARWRRAVNEQLGSSYAAWFALLDALVFLRVPDLACVRRWRWQQEQDTALGAQPAASGLLSQSRIERFIQHYERLTAHALEVMAERADVVLKLGEDHCVQTMRFRDPPTS